VCINHDVLENDIFPRIVYQKKKVDLASDTRIFRAEDYISSLSACVYYESPFPGC